MHALCNPTHVPCDTTGREQQSELLQPSCLLPADMAPVDITLAILPGPAPGDAAPTLNIASSLNSIAQAAPWLSSPDLARLDPGLIAGRNLTQRVKDGTAMWRQVVVRGWPGQYHLLFAAAASGPLAPLAQVGCVNQVACLPACMAMLRCRVLCICMASRSVLFAVSPSRALRALLPGSG